MIADPTPEDEGLARALATGIDLAGSVTGAAAGLLVAGPVGAVGGAVAGTAMTSGLKEVLRRALSHREEARVGGAFHSAAEALRERQEAGDEVRDDEFLRRTAGRSDADEMFEGVLLTAQRSYEERKVPYLSDI